MEAKFVAKKVCRMGNLSCAEVGHSAECICKLRRNLATLGYLL